MFSPRPESKLTPYTPFILIAILALSMASVTIKMTGQAHVFPKESIYLGEDSLLLDVCATGMKSIANKKVSHELLKDDIIEKLETSNYTAFNISITGIYKSYLVDKTTCKLITKNDKGLRAYLVGMEYDSNFPYNYKIKDANEILPTEEDRSEP